MTAPAETPYTAALSDQGVREKLLAICQDRSLLVSGATVAGTFLLFAGGLAMIASSSPLLVACGIPTLAWSLVLAWYLAHECAHRLVFAKRSHNRLLGELLFFISGLSYFRFADYCTEHLRHHVEKVDLVGVDVREIMEALPRPLRNLLLALEYLYVPAVFFHVKYSYLYQILKEGDQGKQTRVLASGALYLAFTLSLAALKPLALCWLFIAISLRVHFVRFVDAFQHSFEEVDADARLTTRKSRRHEQHNTYSFPVARRFRVFNAFILNFGYHNAHHALPSCPWYRLQELADAVGEFQPGPSDRAVPAYLPKLPLLRQYHRHRVSRIMAAGQGTPHKSDGTFDLGGFTGAFTDNLLG